MVVIIMKHPFYQDEQWTGWVDLYWKISNVIPSHVMPFRNISPNYSRGGLRLILGDINES